MLISALAVTVGLLPGFFLVGPAVFADGTDDERTMVMGMIVAVYGLLGAAFGYAAGSWRPALWLSTPGLLMAAAWSDVPAITRVVFAAVLLASLLGAYGGMRLRRQWRPLPEETD